MIVRIRRFAVIASAVTLGALAGSSAAAQQAVQTDAGGSKAPAPSSSAPGTAGPTLERATVGVRPIAADTVSDAAALAAVPRRAGLGKPAALMIVGFAAVFIGLVMNNDPGTLLAIGGAAVGLYGLYQYLQ